MTEGTDAPEQGGAEQSAEDTSMEDYVRERQAENNSEDATEQDTGTDETGQAEEPGEPERPKKTPWWEKRFAELTAQRYEEQRRADYLQGQLEALSRQYQAPQDNGPPDRWEDPEGYDRYLVEQATRQAAQTLQQQLHEAAWQAQRQQVLSTYQEKENAARQALPDYDSIVHDPSLTITPLMAEVIRESDHGPQVAYYLGTHREEAARIANLPPHRQAAALGRIEATYSGTHSAQPRTAPPPPPKTVSGIAAGGSKDPGKMSMSEYIKWRQSQA